jgi:hypothetical protein
MDHRRYSDSVARRGAAAFSCMKTFLSSLCLVLTLVAPSVAAAQKTVNLNASDLVAHTEIFFSPQSGTFLEGSTFDVPIFLDTKGASVNAVELRINFDPNVLSVVRPSGGTSIIGVWIEPPSYDNSKGTAKIVGTIPGGIKTNSGLIATITFQAKQSGTARVSISNASRVLLNDGLGTESSLATNRGTYAVIPKPPEGVQIISDTHPFQDRWYNNNNPTFNWNKDPGVSGFAIALDNKPTTVPDNTLNATDTISQYQNVADGVWYFHVKALKQGVWGAPSHYVVRIDTTPPAVFTPTVDFLSASALGRFLVSFYTSDALAGVDHYEVGVIDKNAPPTESPVFIQTESPYQLPFSATKNARILIRAFDRAGNIREEAVDAKVPFAPLKLITDNEVPILFALLIFIIGLLGVHYLFNHHLVRRMEKGFELLKEEERKEKVVSSEVRSAPPPVI